MKHPVKLLSVITALASVGSFFLMPAFSGVSSASSAVPSDPVPPSVSGDGWGDAAASGPALSPPGVAEPEELAAAFGWSAPAQPSETPEPPSAARQRAVPAEPIDAPWLEYIGIASAQGQGGRYFKDARTGTLIHAAAENAESGWFVLSENEGGFILSGNGALYRVPRP